MYFRKARFQRRKPRRRYVSADGLFDRESGTLISAGMWTRLQHKASQTSKLKMHRTLSHILRLPVVLGHPTDDSSLSVTKSCRACTLNFQLTDSPPNPVLFYGLNFVRFFSIISFILVFAGSFYVMVTDIIAVNKFQRESRQSGNSAEEILAGCNYIRSRVTRQPCTPYRMHTSPLTLFVQEQHRPRPNRRGRLGRNQPIIHHRPSHHPRIFRTRLVLTPLRQVLPRSWIGIWTGSFGGLSMSNRGNSPVAPRPQVRPRLWLLPLFDRRPQYRDRAHPGSRGKNDSFR